MPEGPDREILEYLERPETDAEWIAVITTVQNNLDRIKATFDRWNYVTDTATHEEGLLVWYATLTAELIEKHPEKAKRLQNQARLELCH